MKHLFYEDWYKKRLKKIISILGEDWFVKKKVLELGACHGDVGLGLLHLGSNVTFSDVREENLREIKIKLKKYNLSPSILILNQETEYELNEKFDLIIHMGLLYHLENWKNDLKSVSNSSNLLILESLVNPYKGSEDCMIDFPSEFFRYGPYNDHLKMSYFTQESVEEKLINLGYKFIRFDNSELNSKGWATNYHFINHVYDWSYEKINSNLYNISDNNVFHFRRLWLAIK